MLHSRQSIFPILLVNFIGSLGYSIVLPFLVILVTRFGGNELIYGLMGATYSFFQLIGAPVLGNWSDRIGRRRVLLLSQAGTFLAWLVFLFALLIPETQLSAVNSTFWGSFVITIPLLLLFFARVLDGITGGNISVANAYLADITEEEQRKANFGKMAVSGNLGFILGPAIAGLLGATALGYILPVATAMMISLIAIGVIYFQLKEVHCKPELKRKVENDQMGTVLGAEHKECYRIEGHDSLGFREILQIRFVPYILVIYFLVFLAFNLFYVAFPIYAIQSLEWNAVDLGIFYSLLGGLMALFQGPVLSWLSNKISDALLVFAGTIILSIGFYLFTFNQIYILYTGVVLFAAGNGLMWPSFLSIVSKLGGKKEQGAVQGIASSAGSLASIVGLIAGGLLFGQLGTSLFIIATLILLIIAVGSRPLFRIKTR